MGIEGIVVVLASIVSKTADKKKKRQYPRVELIQFPFRMIHSCSSDLLFSLLASSALGSSKRDKPYTCAAVWVVKLQRRINNANKYGGIWTKYMLFTKYPRPLPPSPLPLAPTRPHSWLHPNARLRVALRCIRFVNNYFVVVLSFESAGLNKMLSPTLSYTEQFGIIWQKH